MMVMHYVHLDSGSPRVRLPPVHVLTQEEVLEKKRERKEQHKHEDSRVKE